MCRARILRGRRDTSDCGAQSGRLLWAGDFAAGVAGAEAMLGLVPVAVVLTRWIRACDAQIS